MDTDYKLKNVIGVKKKENCKTKKLIVKDGFPDKSNQSTSSFITYD